ncbi:putative signal peptide protein [Puccinia sorghi]|uniref:Putative signal peptide protein n=1 Tax=Puccinia sorghi TaxID=27349 RepID=A0A0L6VHZ4_9BASI|nr:putative signal peptide protein [Puccinia sorghi]
MLFFLCSVCLVLFPEINHCNLIDTLFDFDVCDKAPQQSINKIIELDGANEPSKSETNWNPEELWVP